MPPRSTSRPRRGKRPPREGPMPGDERQIHRRRSSMPSTRAIERWPPRGSGVSSLPVLFSDGIGPGREEVSRRGRAGLFFRRDQSHLASCGNGVVLEVVTAEPTKSSMECLRPMPRNSAPRATTAAMTDRGRSGDLGHAGQPSGTDPSLRGVRRSRRFPCGGAS